ncbi:MAG: hypothetical protein OHK0029_06040 [Armatimonadaceae bacterium]
MRYSKFLAVVFCALAVAAPGFAQSKKPAAKTPATPPVSSKIQVQGIVDRTVDGLWEATDTFWHDGDYNRIVDLCRVCVEADPTFNDAYSGAAWLLWSMGDTQAADLLLQHGINRTGKNGELNFEMGWHLYNTRRYAQAEPYLKKAVSAPNAEPRWYAILGHTYRQQKKYDDAIRTWEAVIKKFPNFPPGPSNLERVKILKAERPQ